MKIIARMKSDFPTKFAIPRQSGLSNLTSAIIFEEEYRNRDAVRGLEEFSHIWIIWQFSQSVRSSWSPTVRPPRLGGNQRVGVFATRSPFRPNEIGLSSVKLEKIEYTREYGPVLYVKGADLMDGTPIYDIKPYLPFTDSHPDAVGGFTEETKEYRLSVEIQPEFMDIVPPEKREDLLEVLAGDPRPSYHEDAERIYGFPFAEFEVKFRVKESLLTVTEIKKEC